MRMSGRVLVRTFGAMGLSLALAGCGSGGVDALGGLFGGGDTGASVNPVTASTIAGVPVEQLRADQLCPRVIVRDGTGTLQLFDSSMEQGPRAVRYQAQIEQTAADCTPGAGQLALSVGIAGRVLIGPRGGPASLDLPVRLVVLNRIDGSVLSSQVIRTTAVIEPTETSARFTIVDRSIIIPTPQQRTDFGILVGFDEAAL